MLSGHVSDVNCLCSLHRSQPAYSRDATRKRLEEDIKDISIIIFVDYVQLWPDCDATTELRIFLFHHLPLDLVNTDSLVFVNSRQFSVCLFVCFKVG